MRYLLIVNPIVDKWDDDCMTDIADELIGLSKHETVPYAIDNGLILFQFETTVPKGEVNLMLELMFGNAEEFKYILTQSKNSTTNICDETMEHLSTFSSKKDSKKPKDRVKTVLNVQDDEYIKILSKEVLRIHEEQVNNMSIDEILDKIRTEGIKSLSVAEKNKLDEYSKQI
jgi:hypothetical protein